jgi:hypothetical protein
MGVDLVVWVVVPFYLVEGELGTQGRIEVTCTTPVIRMQSL